MKFARVDREGIEEYGIIRDNNWFKIDGMKRNTFGVENLEYLENIDLSSLEQTCEINDESITWLPPIARPGKIICIGRNYAEHSIEQGKEPEGKPLLFTKFSTSMRGHLSEIPFPSHTENLDYEVELAVIMGKSATKLSDDLDALDYVFGYTIANDLTARDIQKSEKQWTRGKAFDASLPIGPSIVTVDDVRHPNDNDIWLTVNGDKRQLSNTKNMMFNIPFIIRYISQEITLEPGDIILTGTPSGVGYYMEPKNTLKIGDSIACGVTGIGELRFTIS